MLPSRSAVPAGGIAPSMWRSELPDGYATKDFRPRSRIGILLLRRGTSLRGEAENAQGGGLSVNETAINGCGAMIGLVLVTHGRLAAEFVVAMEHVVGKQERYRDPSLSVPMTIWRLAAPTLPTRLPRSIAAGGVHPADRPVRRHAVQPRHLADGDVAEIEVIAGVNLPMLIRLESAPARQIEGGRRRCRRAPGWPEIYLGRVRGSWERPPPDACRRIRFSITNKRGLHARASAKFVTLASGSAGRCRGREGRLRRRRRYLDHGR